MSFSEIAHKVFTRYVYGNNIPKPGTYLRMNGKVFLVQESWGIHQGKSFEKGFRGVVKINPFTKYGVSSGNPISLYIGQDGVWYLPQIGGKYVPVSVQTTL